jgi:hypothetical protein
VTYCDDPLQHEIMARWMKVTGGSGVALEIACQAPESALAAARASGVES